LKTRTHDSCAPFPANTLWKRNNGFEVGISDRIYVRGSWENKALSNLWDHCDWDSQDDAYWDRFWERHYKVYLKEAEKAIHDYANDVEDIGECGG
jgi:hypothetical protein